MYRAEQPGGEFSRQYQELLHRYTEALEKISNEHAHTSAEIAEDYSEGITHWLQRDNHDQRSFERELSQPAERTAQETESACKKTENIILDASPQFVSLLPDEDQQVWQAVQSAIKNYGVDSPVTRNKLNQASSREAEAAMKRLMPQPEPRQARTSSYRQAYESPPRAYSPKREGLFSKIFRRRRGAKRSQRYDSEQPFGAEEPFMDYDEFFRRQQEDFDRMYREMFDDMFKSSGGAYTGQDIPRREQQAPSREQETTQSDAIRETREIIERAIAKDWSAKWLLSTDLGEVRRVINTVRLLRQKAGENHETITDRQIYVRYRRRIESAEPDARLVESVKILTALMGGRPNGKLPF